VWSDVLTVADVQQVTLLAMLDLSAALDCVDQAILLQCLQIGVGHQVDFILSVRTDTADRL